ncbi:epimerase [Leptospira perolatii]|uniref:Epimerase n=1 Tax=Leptospira perolatii TaxID=2023191 RepID=A0A2M9ZJT6_9LEPT|nr:NAD-dependent epimerase/dehydratase family protein [Leptospira perolatii]PJZ69291.1 epimerase [Leptospira perolatii]PJZ72327.1 epimerase [Leptospira perolatii]
MRALVLGGTGGSGQAITLELLSRGIHTTILGRSQQKMENLVEEWGRPRGLELAVGDVFSPESLVPIFQNADFIFQTANVGYVEMEEKLLPLGESVMQAAEQTGKQVVFVDGVYVYGKNPGYSVTEDYPFSPHTKKGKLKEAFANLVFSNRWKKAKPLIVRLPDYYGPTSQAAYLDPTFEALANGKPALFFGPLKPKREYVYLPDAAKMIVEISLRPEFYGQNWNIPGGTISGKEILQIAESVLNKSRILIPIGKRSLQFLGLFDRFLKEVVEMTYLMEDPLLLSGSKYEQKIGPIPKTSFAQGIRNTLEILVRKSQKKESGS